MFQKHGKQAQGTHASDARMPRSCGVGDKSRAYQNATQFFFPLLLLFEELLEQVAECPALLRDHLLQHRIRPEATVNFHSGPHNAAGHGLEAPLTEFRALTNASRPS